VYSYEEETKGNCSYKLDVGAQCGGAGFNCYQHDTCDQFGPWKGFCCPNGHSCQPYAGMFRKWTCQVDVQDQPPGECRAAAAAAAATAAAVAAAVAAVPAAAAAAAAHVMSGPMILSAGTSLVLRGEGAAAVRVG
jgi:hypothetical protein